MTFPGVPSIYYGDEVGVVGEKDPLNRRTYPWGRENEEILNWYKKITSIRSSIDVFKTGSFKSLNLKKNIYGFIREIKNSKDIFNQDREDNIAVVLVNKSKEKINISLVLGGGNYNMHSILDNKTIEVIDGKINVDIQPLKSYIIVKNK